MLVIKLSIHTLNKYFKISVLVYSNLWQMENVNTHKVHVKKRKGNVQQASSYIHRIRLIK